MPGVVVKHFWMNGGWTGAAPAAAVRRGMRVHRRRRKPLPLPVTILELFMEYLQLKVTEDAEI